MVINFMRQIFEAKNRPSDNPLIVHVSSIDMLKTFVEEITPTVCNRIIAERSISYRTFALHSTLRWVVTSNIIG